MLRSLVLTLSLFGASSTFAEASADRWQDPVTGREWVALAHSVTWAEASSGCEASATRLPSLDEWWEAYDRLSSTAFARSLAALRLNAWTADPLPGTTPTTVWTLYLLSGNAGGALATDQAAAACLSSLPADPE